MGDTTVFFNPNCSKCVGTVALLDERAVPYALVEYLRAPPTREALERLIDQLVDPVADLVRTDEAGFAALGMDGLALDRAVVVDLLVAHPELMQRPVVVVGERAIIARPPERVNELLDAPG